jgi:cytochrome c556
MKKTVGLVAAALCLGVFFVGRGQTDEPKRIAPNQAAAFMRLKLDHSQKVLEGLALEDFELVAKHSQQISLLTEDETWKVFQTLEYRHHSAEFQRITNELTKQAQKKNLDGAALAYVQMTMSCVNCHKYVRGVRMARAD